MRKILLYIVLNFLVFSGIKAQVVLNELVSSNYNTIHDEDYDAEDWIEIYNAGTDTINLQGFGLSDNASMPFRWVFPEVLLPPDTFLIVWASGKNRDSVGAPLHTNFSISSSGEEIVLTDNLGVQVDFLPPVALQRDVSYGRFPNGTGSWTYFHQPTPGFYNNTTPSDTIFTPPTFSHPPGLYTDSFYLELSHPDTSVTIIYTLDGSEPDISNLNGTTYPYKNTYPFFPGTPFGPMLQATYNSLAYDSAILVYDRSAEPDYFTQFNTRQHPIYLPPSPVRKAVVVRAKAYSAGMESTEASNTYFVWPQGNPYSIPVISLKIQENYLFDYYTGVYNAGVTFDNWRTSNPTASNANRPMYGNYWRRGRFWEYPLHVEFFEPNSMTPEFNQNAGFRIHGNFSRNRIIKNLRLYARNVYDEKNEFDHDLFDEPVTDTKNPGNTLYKRILLRGDGAGGPVYNDVVFHRLVQPIFNGVSRVKPAIHFINGEYWGLTAIRDRVDQFHYAYNYNVNSDNIVEVECRRTHCHLEIGETGDMNDYFAMRNFIIYNDMSNPALFAQADSMLCMRSFIDHMVLQIFSGDTHYERSYWKVRNPENPEFGDGKWRMYTQDFEQALRNDRNWLSHWASQASLNDRVFGGLLDNDGFKIDFINRFADMLNTAYLPWRFIAITDSVRAEILPYLGEDSLRSDRSEFYTLDERQDLIDWGNQRPNQVRDNIRSHFGIPHTIDVTLNVSDTAAGYVHINTISIKPETLGVDPDPYPWEGKYFRGIPITLKAIPKHGYVFTHWSGDVSSIEDSLYLNQTTHLNIQANFALDSTPDDVIYFWLFDNNISNNTPLDSLMANYTRTGFNGVLSYKSCFSGYPFNSQHPLWRKGSLERRNQPTPLNYRPQANNNTPYENTAVRGLQIRQPLANENDESYIELLIPTHGRREIKLSFAAENDGAANAVIVEYWANGQWTDAGIPKNNFYLPSTYRVFEVDFKGVTEADDNPDFRIRIRFGGEQRFLDLGNRVHINNIAVEGKSYLHTQQSEKQKLVKVFPNPTQADIYIKGEQEITDVVVYNLHGQKVATGNKRAEHWTVPSGNLPKSSYLMRITLISGEEQVVRFIKN
ncbi:MAG: CotH kinase family protein [Cryomorphaceae bacterium]|nr:CotH kinase family protein [Cryomorphaceae bacterium]